MKLWLDGFAEDTQTLDGEILLGMDMHDAQKTRDMKRIL